MARAISVARAVVLWVAWLYVALVAVAVHLVPHVLAWELDRGLRFALVLDVLLLTVLRAAYARLPHRPRSRAFAWLEDASLI